jgi:hypothetical protein
MQISTANLLIAASQGKPSPKAAQPSQSFAAELASKTEKPAEDFAPLAFKKVEAPASEPIAQKPATPYSAPVQMGSQLNIVI